MTTEIGRAYVEPGKLVRPGPRGRTLRLLVGSLQVSATIFALLLADVFLRPQNFVLLRPQNFVLNFVTLFFLIYIGISTLIALYFLPDMLNLAFGVTRLGLDNVRQGAGHDHCPNHPCR